jgi:Domain of unknown function (DUF4333)
MARLVAVIALALLPALLIGCGGKVIDTSKIEDTLQHNLETERKEKVSSVDCPSEQKVEPKATFDCTITLENGKTETATLEIRNEEADVSIVGLHGEAAGSNE